MMDFSNKKVTDGPLRLRPDTDRRPDETKDKQTSGAVVGECKQILGYSLFCLDNRRGIVVARK